jgi:hypothetical protein
MDRLAEREQLKKFLEDLEGVLDWTIKNFDSLAPTPTPDADVRRALVVAWDELRESQILANVTQGLLRGDSDEILAEHGLTGLQLAFKLQAFNAHLLRFESVRDSGPPFEAPSLWSRFLEILRSFRGSRTPSDAAP